MPQLADRYTCTGCLACIGTCAKQALSSCYDDEGHLTYKVNQNLCVECGLCENACPVVVKFQYGNNELSYSQPYAAWCKDERLRANSSSGGVFAGLARFIIDQGGIVIGASLQQNEVKHCVIAAVTDIQKLQGSKYAQSNTDGIYKTTKQFLKKGRCVLFSGLGCQVAGLLSYLGKMEYSGKLYTVDLICGGVPSRYIIDRYLEQNREVNEIAGFRNKSKYEFSVIDIDGQRKVIPLSERPFPLCGFYTELTNRYSCYDCQFNGAHRRSDITIGDLWGDTEYLQEHKKGISVAVAHTEDGRSILAQANIEAHEIGWESFLMHNPRMIDGHKGASHTKARRNLAKAFAEFPYEKLLQVYANKATIREPWLMAKKIWRYLIGRIKGKKYRKQLKKKINSLLNQ